MDKYLIDSNSLISPYRTFYQFDIVPSFWKWFKDTYDQSIYLVDKVKQELCPANAPQQKDRLQIFVEQNCLTRSKVLTTQTDVLTLAKYQKILEYINRSPLYTTRSLHAWATSDKADPWLIALAMAHGYTIVTMEKPNLNLKNNATSKEPRIPDICAVFGVRCINLYDLMREVGCKI